MIPKKLTVLIGSRLAIPVRAIPFITGWGIFPDVLAKSLAREPGRGLRRIFAYHLENGYPVKILPKEWDAVVTRLNALSAALKIAFPDESYLQWKKHSIPEFPEGVFVWLDEFESNLKSDSLFQVTTRVGDDEINLAPMLTDDVRKMIFAGFESFIQQESAPALPHDAPLPESTPEPAQQSESVPALPVSEPVPDVAGPALPPDAPPPASELGKPGEVLPEQTGDAGLSKREKQIREIEAAAASQGYDALNIPTGGKQILMKQCQESNRELFGVGPHPFNGAWKVAISCDPPRLRMADHRKFARK